MNQNSQVSKIFLRQIALTLGAIPLLASIALAQGIVTTYAGIGTRGFGGDGGPATSALFRDPGGLAVDGAGNLYIADFSNNRVRKVTPEGVITTVAGDGRFDTGPIGDGGPATSARIGYPSAVALDSAGNLLIADCWGWRIRKVTTNGIINTLGSEVLVGCDYGGSENAWSMAVDASGNLFVAEPPRSRIRKITPGGVITAVAGVATFGFSGDGDPATSAKLWSPVSVAFDAAGNLFVADTYNHRIRKITPDGIITTVAGTGISGSSGDGGPATSAVIGYPSSVAIDPAGNLLIAEATRIRKVTPDGIITTMAGTGTYGFSGDGGPATSAQFASITGIAVDAAGNLFVSDSGNQRIRKIWFQGPPTLAAVVQDLGSPGATLSVTLHGTKFLAPLTIDAGSGVTIDDVRLTSGISATARLTIASNAVLGPRDVTVTTPLGTSNAATFRVVPPFPDLTVTSSQSAPFAVGSNGVLTIGVQNVGAGDTSGAVTLTDTLSVGLTYVSGVGNGWACSAASPAVTCEHAAPLAAGDSTSLALTVAAGEAAAAGITHEVSVAGAGDAISSNNSVVVATPGLSLRSFPANPVAGSQARIGITLPISFPYDVGGTLRLTFEPDAVNPADDPAIQFATGGRQVTFIIPANTLEARFGGSVQAATVGFQMGTVAGAIVFDGVLEASKVQIPLTSRLTIPRQAPLIESIQLSTANGLEGRITLSSTAREVTHMTLRFITQPAVQPSCGSPVGCFVSSYDSLRFDVKSRFDTWYAGDKEHGSLSTLRFPLSISGSVQGSVEVTLRNIYGESNSLSFPLPK